MIRMRVAVLTSSRADYGIYQPLLRKLQLDSTVDLRLIVFGTHLSQKHGYTVEEIEADGYQIDYRVETMVDADDPSGIAGTMSLCSTKFAVIWEKEQNHYDWVICLGDRYEMFSAVSIAAPFSIKFAHIHGGETTLGAIDNKFRHCLTLFSELHFVATEQYAERVKAIIGNDEIPMSEYSPTVDERFGHSIRSFKNKLYSNETAMQSLDTQGHEKEVGGSICPLKNKLFSDETKVFTVGALSLDNIDEISLYSKIEFQEKFNINIDIPTVLVTFHPETVAYEKNLLYVNEVIAALNVLEEQIIITMPNADTMGNLLREAYMNFAIQKKNVILIENFGIRGYFTCMKYAQYLLGNTSSGIIEAASFGKFVINIGDRQKGRACSENIIHVNAEQKNILSACYQVKILGSFLGTNIYQKNQKAADTIIKVLKENARL